MQLRDRQSRLEQTARSPKEDMMIHQNAYFARQIAAAITCLCILSGSMPYSSLAIEAQEMQTADSSASCADHPSARHTFETPSSSSDTSDPALSASAERETSRPMEPLHFDENGNRITQTDTIPEYSVEVDPRTEVSNTTRLPYSAICKLTMVFADEEGEEYRFVGSGCFVGRNVLLTCGHCVYDRENRLGWVDEIYIEPGLSPQGSPFGMYSSDDIEYIEADEGWLTDGSEDDDNALIVFKENVADQSGYLSFSAEGVEAGRVHLSGYPAKFRNETDEATQVESWGEHLRLNGRCLESDVYGSGGQSGSPILNEEGKVVATFAYDYVYANRTGGPVMDPERIAWVAAHAQVRNPIYRLYNPNSGEHFYTMDCDEMHALSSLGWRQEGVAWQSYIEDDAMPVYRLYNPNSGDHHYTADQREYSILGKLGWRQEGISWKAAPAQDTYYQAVYRLYNPNATVGQHHFTRSYEEARALVALGWKNENIAFYTED